MTDKQQFLTEAKVIAAKMQALVIILGSPLWPKRDGLNEVGKALYDAILRDAKNYATMVAEERWQDALAVLAAWPVHPFIGQTQINSENAVERMTNRRLLHVFRHYANAAGFDLNGVRV